MHAKIDSLVFFTYFKIFGLTELTATPLTLTITLSAVSRRLMTQATRTLRIFTGETAVGAVACGWTAGSRCYRKKKRTTKFKAVNSDK